MVSSKLAGSLPAMRRSNSRVGRPMRQTRFSQSARGAAPRVPASRQADMMSSGITKGGESQFSAWRVAAISSSPSGEPCAALVPALVGAPKPMVVLAAISVGLSDFCAVSIAAAIASGSWPSMSEGVPVGRLEARDLVGRVGQRDGSVDRDRVVVPEDDQLVELEVAGKRDRLLADAFHQAAVADDHIGVVVDEVVAELRVHDRARRAPCRRNWRGPGRAGRWSSRCPRRNHIPGGRRSSNRAGGSCLISSIVMSA